MSGLPPFAQINPGLTSSPFPVLGSINGNLRLVATWTGDGAASRIFTTGSPRSYIVIEDKTNATSDLIFISDSGAIYGLNGIGGSSNYINETVLAYATAFPSLTTMDAGAINNTGVANANVLNHAYRLWVYG